MRGSFATIPANSPINIAKAARVHENPPMPLPDDHPPIRPPRLARWIFILAAVYGFPVLGVFFFFNPNMIRFASRQQPEIYYGFAAIGLAWQAVFLLIAFDPPRYRPLMLIAAIGEKFFFVAILVVLMLRHIARPHWIPPAVCDFILGLAFVVAYAITTPNKHLPRVGQK